MTDFFEDFLNNLGHQPIDIRTYSPLALAFVGDSIYASLIKLHVVYQANASANQYHRLTKKYVSAKAQAQILDYIWPYLTEEEINYVRRGRNAKSLSIPKNTSKQEYQKATGYECLLGYLFITKQYHRLTDIVTKGMEYGKTNPNIN